MFRLGRLLVDCPAWALVTRVVPPRNGCGASESRDPKGEVSIMRGQIGGVRVSKSAILLLMGAVVLAFAVSSCAKPPQVEIDAANAALDRARQMEAEEYAPNELRAASDSLEAANREVTTQDGKFALFRSYKNAKALYITTAQLAQTAEQAAVRNKEQARIDAQAALEEVRKTIIDTRALMDSPDGQALRRGKETREVLKQIDSEIAAIDSSLSNVTTLQQQEKYKQALNMARSAQQSAMAKMQELQAAIEARKQTMGMRK